MAAAVEINDIMDDEDSFQTILVNLTLEELATQHFMEDFPTMRDLMFSDSETIKRVISSQNKMFRRHADEDERCYITALQQKYILALYRWTIFAITDAGAKYETDEVEEFTEPWVRAIVDEYNIPDPGKTPQSTSFSVEVPKFQGTNWFEVKSKFVSLLNTRIGSAGIPLSYLVRTVRKTWEDTEDVQPLQERRMQTKKLEGNSFNRDNREFYRILLHTFSGTTLEDIVKSEQGTNNGLLSWNKIKANVEGSY